MEGNKRVAALGFCLLAVLAMASQASARHAAPHCNLNSLLPCYSAVVGAHVGVPTSSCCSAVRHVNKQCLCRELMSGSYPGHMVSNALQLPKRCHRYDLAGFRCGRYTVPH